MRRDGWRYRAHTPVARLRSTPVLDASVPSARNQTAGTEVEPAGDRAVGKKNAARKIVYDALDIITKKVGGDKEKGLSFFLKALDQIIPAVEVRPRRVGGSVYQIPMEVVSHRGRALAMRWLIAAAKVRPDKTMGIRLAHELQEAHEGRGAAVKKRLDVHKMAEANRAFSHYAW